MTTEKEKIVESVVNKHTFEDMTLDNILRIETECQRALKQKGYDERISLNFMNGTYIGVDFL